MEAPPLPEYARLLHYQASSGHDAWDLLPTIRNPTLVIHGSEDQLNPTANAYLLAEHIPGAELYMIEGGRHFYPQEFREEAGRVVREFLARHPLSWFAVGRTVTKWAASTADDRDHWCRHHPHDHAEDGFRSWRLGGRNGPPCSCRRVSHLRLDERLKHEGGWSADHPPSCCFRTLL